MGRGDVVGAEGEQSERAVRLKDREAARPRLPGRLDRAALWKIQLDVVAAGGLAVAGEEPDGDLHDVRETLRTGETIRSRRKTSRWGSCWGNPPPACCCPRSRSRCPEGTARSCCPRGP